MSGNSQSNYYYYSVSLSAGSSLPSASAASGCGTRHRTEGANNIEQAVLTEAPSSRLEPGEEARDMSENNRDRPVLVHQDSAERRSAIMSGLPSEEQKG